MYSEKERQLMELLNSLNGDPRFNDMTKFIIQLKIRYSDEKIPSIKVCCKDFNKTEKTIRRYFSIFKEIKLIRKIDDEHGERWEFRI